MSLKVDLGVNTANPLYEGLGVTEVGGRFNLPEATSANVLNAVGKAVKGMVDGCAERDEVILTGPAPVQVYLVAFHCVLHAFRTVRYQDGKGGDCVIAQHG